MMSEKPWIIMTLRRTGGTSLTSFLSKVSSFPSLQQEPFNKNRELWHISKDFRESNDFEKLNAAIDSALQNRPNIKHCIDVGPMEVTQALIDAALVRDYYFIVLNRRNEARRLASLLVAQATNAWDHEEASEIYPKIVSGEIIPTPIELESVGSLVRQNAVAMGRTLTLLRNREINFDWLLFEDVYQGPNSVEKIAQELASRIGIDVNEDTPALAEVFAPGGQQSMKIARYVENYELAVKRLTRLCLQ